MKNRYVYLIAFGCFCFGVVVAGLSVKMTNVNLSHRTAERDNLLPIECREFDLKLISAIKFVESSGNAKAIGDGGRSYGLMQLQYRTAKELGYKGKPAGLLDPQTNMRYGCMYLSKLYKEKKDLNRALDAYNRGSKTELDRQYKGSWSKHKYVGKIKKEMSK